MRILGLDLGERRIGLALSPEGSIAVGFGLLECRDPESDLTRLGEIIRQEAIEELVVGLPRRLDGSLGPEAQKTLEFIQTLQEKFGLPVNPWDERLSTVSAEKALLEGDLSRRRRRGLRDQAAATLILQAFLDRRRHDGLRRDQDG